MAMGFMTDRFGALGTWLIGILSVVGLAVSGYVLITPVPAGDSTLKGLVILGIPLAFTGLFLGYVWRFRDDAFSATLVRYGGIGAVLGGLNFLLVPVVISGMLIDRRVGAVLVQQHVLIIDMVLAGAMFGLVLGHLYGRNQAERARLRRREAQLDRQRHHLTLLNRVLRHDIRNAINVISVYLSNLAAEPTDGRSVRVIEERCEEILDLSENARQLESVMGERDTHLEPVEVVGIIDHVVGNSRREHPTAVIRTDLPDAAWVEANDLLDSAITNLIGNAIEHNDAEPPTVEISVSSAANRTDTIDIRIADNGPGLPEQELAIFESGEESTVEHSDGLGLWLVHWIIEDCNGSIHIATGSDGGTAVTVTLSAMTPDATAG